MATLTIRNLTETMVTRIKARARRRGVSMEQEVRDLLESRYAPRDQVLARVRERWDELPPASAREIDRWREIGRR